MAEAFLLPPELDLVANHEVLTIRYPGDAVLENDLGMESFDVDVEGDLTVRLDRVTGILRCGGTLRIEGQIDGGSLHARDIVLGDGEVRCRAIEAVDHIQIGPAKLMVDVIIAPQIEIDPEARGRVTVIESKTERGPTKIKGGFTVAEYEELLGGSEAFLAERGLSPLAGTPAPPPPRAEKRSKKKKEEPEEPPAPLEDEDEDIDDPLSLNVEDLVFVEVDAEEAPRTQDEDEEPEAAPDAELQFALEDAVDRIVRCYPEGELPPPVERLQELVDAHDYDVLRGDITDVWNGLLGYHQKRGLRPHHQVTHAFNVIHGLLQPA